MPPSRVLVADDSRIFRLLVSEVLRDRGIAVVEASNGREALDQTLSERPELLILDEPTASLDGDTGRKIIHFVKQNILDEKRCIIIVTHDSRIFEYSDRMLKMEDGSIVGISKGGVSEE